MKDKGQEAEQFRKLFIGGLDYRTTDENLKNFYSQWGEIVDVVVMKHPTTGKSRGFGFVTYSDMDMVDKAMANRPHKIDGREVDSKRAVPRDESGRPDANQNVRKMFVGGLKDQPEEDLKDYFSKFGKVVNVNIVTDQDGKRKGFCFIEFDDYDPVDRCVLYKNHNVSGKSLTVKKAVPKDSMGKGGGGGGRGGGGRDSGGRGGPRGGGGGGGKWGGGGQNPDVWGGGNQWGSGGGGGYGGGGGGYGSGGGGGWGDGGQSGGGPAWGGGGNNSWNDRQGGGGGGWGGGGGNMGGGGGYGGGSGGGGYGGGGGGYGGGPGGGGGGGGPVRNNYLSQNRNAPYSSGGGGGGYGGGSGGGGSWGGGGGGGRY